MIFISYRRDDAAGYARAVYDALAQRFGAERVFIDVDDIGAGEPFDAVIRRAVGGAKVLLVLIGKRWRGERDAGQPARLFDADDFVRLEVAAGLANNMTVIPLLLDGAAMPNAEQLPPELQPLARRNALALDNARFAADIERVVAALQAPLGRPRRRRLLPLLAVLVAGSGGAAVWWRRRPRPAPISGAWQAAVTYDWPNAHHDERFDFTVDGSSVHGSASFLGVPRGLLDGRLDGDVLTFVTRTGELGGAEQVHRYRGRIAGSDEIGFVMQTEGGSSAHRPVEFVARRAPAR